SPRPIPRTSPSPFRTWNTTSRCWPSRAPKPSLPDAPLFEEHRKNDQTTAEHDRATRRNPRYWIDMNDAIFKEEQVKMRARVDMIDTFSRPNLIAQYVEYPL